MDDSAELHDIRDKEGSEMLDRLQAMWDSGELPQMLTPKSR
ncbi:hypothetical protein [Actinomadura sp. 6N118]